MREAERRKICDEMLELLPRLQRFACALTGSRDAGDDLVQTTCERAIANLHQWKPGTRLDSWMFRIARNSFLNELRTARNRGPHLEISELEESLEGGDGERTVLGRQQFREVGDFVAKLPEEQRAVLLLVCVEGYSYAEAGEILDLPVGTVTSRLGRARIAIAEACGGAAPD